MSSDCPECTETRACGNYHVYVIELKKNVLKLESSFPFEGELARGKRVYYVGMTKHRPYCRYTQHVGKRTKSRKNFDCTCFTEETVRRLKKKGGRYVREKRYRKKGLGLRPKLYSHLNPTVRTDVPRRKNIAIELENLAKDAERELAESLRADGHAVHYN